jgi:hypothetical protein
VDDEAAALKIVGVDASSSADLAALTDGDRFTIWDAGPQQTGREWITFDLGAVHQVSALTLASGAVFGGHARAIAVDLSTDGVQWTTVFQDQGGALAVRGAQADPRMRPATYSFAPADARLVRARQIGHADKFQWAIAEAAVLGR